MSELGQTRDPRSLIPGNPAAMRMSVRELTARSAAAEAAGDGLARIDTGAWVGPAAEAFRSGFSYEPGKWFAAADSLSTAADALTSYADVVEWAQGRAAEAIRLWDAARPAETSPGQVVPPSVDSPEAGRSAAEDVLSSARNQVSEAARITAGFLNAEADAAPEKSGWLDSAGGFAKDVGAHLVNGLASYGNAMLHHPGEVVTALGGIALMSVSAAGDGLGVALDATGIGAIGGLPLNAVSTAGIVTGAGITAAASGLLMQHAAGEDAVSPVEGSPPAKSAPTKTDRMKEHLTERDLDAARRELDGEVVARKPSGQPWDHVDEVRNAQRGLVRRIRQLKYLVGDVRTGAADRAAYESELSEASRLLDHSEQFVPRVQP